MSELRELQKLIDIILLDYEDTYVQLYTYHPGWDNNDIGILFAEHRRAIQNHFDKLQFKEPREVNGVKEKLSNEEKMINYEIFERWEENVKEYDNKMVNKNKGDNF